MERIIDIAVVFAGCVATFVVAGLLGARDAGTTGAAAAGSLLLVDGAAASAAAVACLLLAVIVVFGCEWARSRWRMLGLVAFCALALAVPEGLLLMPSVVYELCRFVRERMPWRAAPLMAFAPFALAVAVHHVPAGTIVLSAALCAFAALISMRTSALLAQRDLRHRARDEYRQRELIEVGGRSDERLGVSDLLASRAAHGGVGSSVEVCSGEVPALCGASGPDVSGSSGLPHPSVVSPDEHCRAAFAQITDREYEVVSLIAEGLDNHEIAAAAFISEGTVRNRISSALQKTGYKNRTQLAVAWWQARAIR